MANEEMTGRPGPESDSNKILAALGYVFWIISLVMVLTEPSKKDPFLRYHAWQGLFTSIVYALGFIVYWIPVIGWLLWIAATIYVIYLGVQAYQEKYFEVPVIYGFAKKYMEG